MSLQRLVSITSTARAIKRSKKLGHLDLSLVALYNMYNYYISFADNKVVYTEESVKLHDRVNDLKQKYTSDLCTLKGKAPTNILTENISNVGGGVTLVAPLASDFTVTNFTQETLFGVGDTYSTHQFTTAEFENVYTSTDGSAAFDFLVIDRNSIADYALKYSTGGGTGNIFGGPTNLELQIPYSQLTSWSMYSSSTSVFTHTMSFKFRDINGNTTIDSNTATMTLDRSTSSGNQKISSLGDSFKRVDNNVTTVITYAMLTSGLTPPYNDPEGDLIDAIRIIEISTANSGVYNFDGVPVTEGQIIYREDIDLDKFTHVGANVSDITSDVIRFEARDEGSLIWVE